MCTPEEPLEILLIEDCPADANIVMEMLQELGVSIHITLAKDGGQAIDILRLKDPSSVPAVDLVILDLNLPKVHGHDVLSQIRASDKMRRVPVVVLTGSLNEEDEIISRKMGVLDYRRKPADSAEYDATCKWLGNVLIQAAREGRMRDSKTACVADPGNIPLSITRSPWEGRLDFVLSPFHMGFELFGDRKF